MLGAVFENYIGRICACKHLLKSDVFRVLSDFDSFLVVKTKHKKPDTQTHRQLSFRSLIFLIHYKLNISTLILTLNINLCYQQFQICSFQYICDMDMFNISINI